MGRLDLIHLGMGADGHTASLFPGSPALEVSDRLVVATVDPTGRNPHPRLTFTLTMIQTARLVLVTVSGPEKAPAVARVLAGDPDLPASRIRGARVTWILDRDAAAVSGGTGSSTSTGG